ncbi:MAG: DMT family transporter [Proteobacteria bacterium]|nr:DMT family transporter [Pseudomonadota bacterium]
MQPFNFAALAPALFVFLWSTGFIGARYGLPHAEPHTFLAIRFVIVIAMLAVVARWRGAAWPREPRVYAHLAVSGVLMHSTYLGGVFSAIHGGLNAGLAALIVGTQPLITAAVVGPLFGERLHGRQWLGFVLGFVGLTLVLSKSFARGDLPASAALCAVVGLAGITIGTLYQKRYVVNVDLWSGSLVQFCAALVPTAALAFAVEQRAVEWTPSFVFALAWLCVVLSLGAIGVLWTLIQRGAAARVASLFYLVPPATAFEAWLLFGETLLVTQMVGIALTALGVAMINRAPSRR